MSEIVESCNDLSNCDAAFGQAIEDLPQTIGLDMDTLDTEMEKDPEVLKIGIKFLDIMPKLD